MPRPALLITCVFAVAFTPMAALAGAASLEAPRRYGYRLNGQPAGEMMLQLQRDGDGYRLTRSAHLSVRRGERKVSLRTRLQAFLDAKLGLRRLRLETRDDQGLRRMDARREGSSVLLQQIHPSGRRSEQRVAWPKTGLLPSAALDLLPVLDPTWRDASRARRLPVLLENKGTVVEARATPEKARLRWSLGGLGYSVVLDGEGWPREVRLEGGLSAHRLSSGAAPPPTARISPLGSGTTLPEPGSLRRLTLRLRADGLKSAALAPAEGQRTYDEGPGEVLIERDRGRLVPGAVALVEAVSAELGEGRDDCRARAALAAERAGAFGLRARRVVGLVFSDGAFGYHEWVEVKRPGARRWWPVDPTLEQPVADVTHVALARPSTKLDGTQLMLELVAGLDLQVIDYEVEP